MTNPESFRKQAPSMAEAWTKWRASFRKQTCAGSDLIVSAAALTKGMRVLDLGSGVGEPAFALAAALGPTGHVVASDLVLEAMSALTEDAQRAGVSNIECVQANMQALPFGDASFDRVTGRLSLMFSPDLEVALSEVRRVLKPEGLAVFVVWGSPDQPLFANTLGVLAKHITLPIPPSGEPGPFRFAPSGSLHQALRAAGFRDVEERTCALSWPWPGPASEMWAAFSDLSGPAFGDELGQLSSERRAAIEREIIEALTAYEQDNVTDPQASVVLGIGRR